MDGWGGMVRDMDGARGRRRRAPPAGGRRWMRGCLCPGSAARPAPASPPRAGSLCGGPGKEPRAKSPEHLQGLLRQRRLLAAGCKGQVLPGHGVRGFARLSSVGIARKDAATCRSIASSFGELRRFRTRFNSSVGLDLGGLFQCKQFNGSAIVQRYNRVPREVLQPQFRCFLVVRCLAASVLFCLYWNVCMKVTALCVFTS